MKHPTWNHAWSNLEAECLNATIGQATLGQLEPHPVKSCLLAYIIQFILYLQVNDITVLLMRCDSTDGWQWNDLK